MKIFDKNGIEYWEVPYSRLTVQAESNYMGFTPSESFVSNDLYLRAPYIYNNHVDLTIDSPSTYNSKSISINLGYELNIIVTDKMEADGTGNLVTTIDANGSLDYGTNTHIISSNTYKAPTWLWEETRAIPIAFTENGIIRCCGICIIQFLQGRFSLSANTLAFNSSGGIVAGVIFDFNYHGITIKNDNIIGYREADITNNTTSGGGYGVGKLPADNILIPTLPAINISNTGSTLYALTAEQMSSFKDWLWTSNWEETIKKIRTDPMQNIIGVSLVDIDNIISSSAAIYVGNVQSTVAAGVVTNTFITVDCGSINLEEYYGTFADYEPFCATTLYLPKVGFVQIPADVCINNNIHVVYNIELCSGEGLCFVLIESTRDNFSYIWNTYTCNITSNITLSAQDHTQQVLALGNAIINTTATTAGAITNPSAIPAAFTSVASNCFNVATTKNPTQTKGNIGNMSAIMCYKKPYILINKTNLTKPSSFQENNGYLINYSAKIQGHTGFLKTRDYHCEFNAPFNHRTEIERLLDTGVIIND